MREFASEIFLFIYSTLSYWQALVSGGVITALIAIFERLSGYRLNKKTYVGLFVGVFLVVAFFLGWREERAGRLRQEAEVNRMHSTKPRLTGDFEYFRMGSVPELPSYLGVAMVMSISNVGSTPSIADHWKCYWNMETGTGIETVQGEARAFPEGLEMPRGGNAPMTFARDDALYIKTMRSPIAPGAKVMGVMFCRFPQAALGNINSSEANNIVVEFKDVLGEKHEAKLRYLNQPGFHYGDKRLQTGEWIDIPGFDRPPVAPTGSPHRTVIQ